MMNRKAVSILINLIFVVALLIVAFLILGDIVKPLLNPTSKTVTYENFQVLTMKINNVLNDDFAKNDEGMFFQMNQNFAVLAFDPESNKVQMCFRLSDEDRFTKEFQKPQECETDKACICLYNFKK